MGPMMMTPGSGALWLPVIVVLFLVLLVAGGVAAAVLAGRSRRPAQLPPPPDPVETLKQRYAAGEIDHDELDRRLDLLLRR